MLRPCLIRILHDGLSRERVVSVMKLSGATSPRRAQDALTTADRMPALPSRDELPLKVCPTPEAASRQRRSGWRLVETFAASAWDRACAPATAGCVQAGRRA